MKAELIISFAGAMALAGCNNNAQTDEAAGSAAANVSPATPLPSESPTTSTAPTTPQAFVDHAASSDLYEIAAAKLAQQMGQNEQLRSFAGMMVKDHTQSSAELKAAVAKAGGGLMMPSAMQGPQQAQLDALKKSGANFTTVYSQQQVAAHQAALMLLQGQASSGTVPALKDFAAKAVPVVQHHLEEAMKLG
jgi:putative membrane protein